MVCDLLTSCSASELFDHYNTTLRSLLDIQAPVKTVCIRAARTAPGMTKTVGVRSNPSKLHELFREKKETRRLEKLYRRTKVGDNKFSSSTNGCFFFNRNSVATGLQRSTRAEVTQRLYG